MLKVAAAQIKITNSLEKNLGKILLFIKKAASKKADIICFPETSLIHSKNKNAIKNAPIKKYFEKIKSSCKENKIYCIFGSNVSDKNKIFNSAFLVDDNGRLVYRYDKANLWVYEKKNKANGSKNKVIETKFGKIGIIICWDIAYPEYVKRLAKKGAWVIFCPSYIKNYGRELESYLGLPYSRAFENSAYFVSCDSANKECAQYSIICGPSKKYSEIKGKEGIIFAELDKKKIAGIRKRYKLV